jgi:hypothetical protein
MGGNTRRKMTRQTNKTRSIIGGGGPPPVANVAGLTDGICHVLVIMDSTGKNITKMYLSSDYFLPVVDDTNTLSLPPTTGYRYVGMVDIDSKAVNKSQMKFVRCPNNITKVNMPIPFESIPTEFP